MTRPPGGLSDHDVDATVGDLDWIRLRANGRIHDRPAARDLELPAVPAAADDLSFSAVDVSEVARGQSGAGDGTPAECAAAVRADVSERIEATADVKDPDAESVEIQDEGTAYLDLPLPTDKELSPLGCFRHPLPPPRSRQTSPSGVAAARRARARSR